MKRTLLTVISTLCTLLTFGQLYTIDPSYGKTFNRAEFKYNIKLPVGDTLISNTSKPGDGEFILRTTGGDTTAYIKAGGIWRRLGGGGGTTPDLQAVTDVGNVTLNPVSLLGGLALKTNVITASTPLNSSYNIVMSNGTGSGPGASSVILPNAVGNTGRIYTIKRTNTGTTNISTSGGTIDGSSSYSLNPSGTTGNDFVTVVSDGTNWKVIGKSYVLPTVPGTPSLQSVTNVGSITTNSITTSGGLMITGNSALTSVAGFSMGYDPSAPTGDFLTASNVSGEFDRITFYTSESTGRDTAAIQMQTGTPGLGSASFWLKPDGSNTRPIGYFEGGLSAYGIGLQARTVTASTTATVSDYTIINTATSGTPVITLDGPAGTIHVLVEEAASSANNMSWTPAITYKGSTYGNASTAPLNAYSRFTVQNIGGTWYLIGAN